MLCPCLGVLEGELRLVYRTHSNGRTPAHEREIRKQLKTKKGNSRNGAVGYANVNGRLEAALCQKDKATQIVSVLLTSRDRQVKLKLQLD